MAKRSGKFYFANEKEVMKSLGLKPTKGSGSGWIEKEDGQNDFIIAQLKSTDAESYRITLKDVGILERNADIAHKIPIFVVEFLQTKELFILVKPMDIPEVAKYIECGVCVKPKTIELECQRDTNGTMKIDWPDENIIQSSDKGRNKFYEGREKERKEWQKKLKSKA